MLRKLTRMRVKLASTSKQLLGELARYVCSRHLFQRFPSTLLYGRTFTRSILLQNNDATFDKKFQSLHLGDKYIDPLKATLQADNLKRTKNVTDHAFKVISPMKKSTTPGDFVGTLGGKVEYYAVSRCISNQHDSFFMQGTVAHFCSSVAACQVV